MKSEKEVLDALNVLKSLCEENDGRCSKCMLRNGEGYCGVVTDSRGDCYDKLKDWELKFKSRKSLIRTIFKTTLL